MALNICKCLQMVQNGFKWLQMASNGSKLLQMAPNGCEWLCLSVKQLNTERTNSRLVRHAFPKQANSPNSVPAPVNTGRVVAAGLVTRRYHEFHSSPFHSFPSFRGWPLRGGSLASSPFEGRSSPPNQASLLSSHPSPCSPRRAKAKLSF